MKGMFNHYFVNFFVYHHVDFFMPVMLLGGWLFCTLHLEHMAMLFEMTGRGVLFLYYGAMHQYHVESSGLRV